MQQALDGVVAVPWTLMLDRWRAGVFDGTTKVEDLNTSWWDLRKEYQGITSPIPRDQDAFCLLYTSPSPRDLSTSRMPSSA